MSYHEGTNWQAKKEDEGKPLYETSPQQVEDLKDHIASQDSIIKGYKEQIKLLEQKHYGYWQLCPKCDGEGSVSTEGLQTATTRICPVCNGAKLLVRPEIKSV